MDRETIESRLSKVFEQLASIEHRRWSHWQQYLHEKCTKMDDGSLVIPPHLVDQWQKQIATPYEQLSEVEKESDREQVRMYLSTIIGALATK